MPGNNVALWQSPAPPAVPDSLSNPSSITEFALQLRPRERNQIAVNFEQGNFELVVTFVWTRTMALLKQQIATLGSAFIGELLQRSDVDEYTDIATTISDSEAISLARDLGIISPTQTMRLQHSRETVAHFAGWTVTPDAADDAEMTLEDAVSCLRVCVQSVLGQENVGAAEDFKAFRTKLSSETLTNNSPEIEKLGTSPYFFLRTAISVLLALFKSSRGAQLEHAARNARIIIPKYWGQLREPERWQVGQAYAVEFSEGRSDSVRGLYAVLLDVSGFDYVPENLRSNTFVKVANAVIAAHEAMNNFYNEPGPMRELANLGTSIPNPALPACMTATLCVRLGNPYGVSRDAQLYAMQLLRGLSLDRWYFYLDGRLEQDSLILPKLGYDGPLDRWLSLFDSIEIDTSRISSKPVRDLMVATKEKNKSRVKTIARRIYEKASGLS